MKCEPGKCIKCGESITINGRPAAHFVEDEFELSDGNRLLVARCSKCSISPPERGEVMTAVNAALLPHPLTGEIVGVVRSRNYIDIMKEMQGCKCECGNDISETFVFNGQKLFCGHCRSVPKVSEKLEKPSRAGDKALKSANKIQRRDKKGIVNVSV